MYYWNDVWNNLSLFNIHKKMTNWIAQCNQNVLSLKVYFLDNQFLIIFSAIYNRNYDIFLNDCVDRIIALHGCPLNRNLLCFKEITTSFREAKKNKFLFIGISRKCMVNYLILLKSGYGKKRGHWIFALFLLEMAP